MPTYDCWIENENLPRQKPFNRVACLSGKLDLNEERLHLSLNDTVWSRNLLTGSRFVRQQKSNGKFVWSGDFSLDDIPYFVLAEDCLVFNLNNYPDEIYPISIRLTGTQMKQLRKQLTEDIKRIQLVDDKLWLLAMDRSKFDFIHQTYQHTKLVMPQYFVILNNQKYQSVDESKLPSTSMPELVEIVERRHQRNLRELFPNLETKLFNGKYSVEDLLLFREILHRKQAKEEELKAAKRSKRKRRYFRYSFRRKFRMFFKFSHV